MDEIEITFPKEIEKQYSAEYSKKMALIQDREKEIQTFYSELYNPSKIINEEKEVLETFISNLKSGLAKELIELIASFKNMKLYKRFVASAFIYNRIKKLPEPFDKFLYLCIAVEAALNFDSEDFSRRSEKFRLFFKENLSTENKLKLISSFRDGVFDSYLEKGQRIDKRIMLPSCYDENVCYVEGGRCEPSVACPLLSDEKRLNEQLDLVLRYIYQKRSAFVHEGKLFFLYERYSKAGMNFLGGYILDVFHIVKGNKIVDSKPVLVSLDFGDLCICYEESLLNYFKKLSVEEDTNCEVGSDGTDTER